MPVTTPEQARSDAEGSPLKRHWLTVVSIASIVGLGAWVFGGGPGAPDLEIPRITQWWWALAAVGFYVLSLGGTTLTLLAASPARVNPWIGFFAQLAGAATKLVTPASSGVMGVNARLMSKHGVSVTKSVTSVGASQLAQFLGTLALTLVVLPSHLRVIVSKLLEPRVMLIVIAVALVVAGLVTFLLLARRLEKTRRHGHEALMHLWRVVRSPKRAAALAFGSILLTIALWACLWCCAKALGGHISYTAAVLALLAASSLGLSLPTPGGLGGVEGAMVAGLLAGGTEASLVLPAVLLFRLVTFWLPIPFGAVCLGWLRRRKYL